IKAILCMRNRAIPGNLHFRTLNPRIELRGTRLELATERRAWAPASGRRIAGVSSFGMSGTNAHVVLEDGRRETPANGGPRRTYAVTLSARTEAALRDAVTSMRGYLSYEGNDEAIADIAYTAAVRR